jgi:hypothetical protein
VTILIKIPAIEIQILDASLVVNLHVLEVVDARLSSSGFRVYKASGAQKALGILNEKRLTL